jgi:hypothetical protein
LAVFPTSQGFKTMIGIISKASESPVVNEFFQLFKTPWEFYDNKASYDVVIATTDNIPSINTKLLIIYDSGETLSNSKQPSIKSRHNTILIKTGEMILPLYGCIQSVNDKGHPIITELNNSNVIGVQTENNEKRIIKIGYDLFREIEFLISSGQPSRYANIPTIDYHISILRRLILDAGIPVMEIPPVPAGFNFIVCLTHDVDFVRIRDHKFDHTMWGFVYRAIFGSFLNFLKKRTTLNKLWKNWKAVLLLPFVYAGVCRDFWLQFDRYIEVESDTPSTFFIIPFKNRIGEKLSNVFARRRATKYDIADIQAYVKKLLSHGFEIGVHGIDAWHSVSLGRQEFYRICEVTGLSNIGIRIHWLNFNEHSYSILEQANFSYDSTFGYNDTIGYRGGTGQVFKPLGVKKILELPLHIQDTALFSPRRMNLSEKQAQNLCNKLIKHSLSHGGVLTVLWHQRSIAPERLYDSYYINLIEILKNHNAWFGTANQVVEWFRKRRKTHFDTVQFTDSTVKLKLKSPETDPEHSLLIRTYFPDIKYSVESGTSNYTIKCLDVPWNGETSMEIPICLSPKIN